MLSQLDKRSPLLHSDDIAVFMVVRNEAARLPWFLEYYRNLGVSRFFVVDNASDDDTRELLLSQDDVHLFFTDASYRENGCGRNWTDELRDAHGVGHWCLTLDADELLVFPLSEFLGLGEFTAYLDSFGYQGLFTLMLDMYGKGPLNETHYVPGSPFVDACTYFDSGPYKAAVADTFPPISCYGGVRRRVFFQNEQRGVVLRKVPLVKWQAGYRYFSSTHSLSELRLADVTGALLHFKFFSHFQEYAAEELRRGERPQHVADYDRYAEVTGTRPDIVFFNSESTAYESSTQLVRLGLVRASKQYLNAIHPLLRKRFGNKQAATIRAPIKEAMLHAERVFAPDMRQALQLWEALTR